jgi:uncharacterized membrane protein YjjP (DUF1212 family)
MNVEGQSGRHDPDDGPVDPGEVRQLIVALGEAMAAAGDSVDAIATKLERALNAYGIGTHQVAVFPTAFMVQTGEGPVARLALGTTVPSQLRFDQISELYPLIARVINGGVPPGEALGQLRTILTNPVRFHWYARVLGQALITLGFAMLLQPTPVTLAVCFGLGLLIGTLSLSSLPLVNQIFPVLMAFMTGVIVLTLSNHFHLDNPIRIMVPPLVMFLPGGMLTIATVELSAGEMIAGASRLVAGLVQLLLLAFGLLAATTVVHVSSRVLHDNPTGRLGGWAPWVGIVVFAVGNYLLFAAPTRYFPWILAVLFVAYGGQRLGAQIVGSEISAFFGALAMTPMVLWFDSLSAGPPKLVTFQPGFWLLVPGTAGLIGIAQILGAGGGGGRAFVSALVTVGSIAVGVLIGSSLYRTAVAGTRRVSQVVEDQIPWPHP